MKVICYDRFKPGVTMEQVRPLLPEETAHAWRLWKRGIIRENYATADQPGVVIVFEVAPTRRRPGSASTTSQWPRQVFWSGSASL